MNGNQPNQKEVAFDDSDENAGFNGAELSESVLGREGLGTLMVSAVRARDLPLVMGIVLFTSTAVWLGNAVGELLQAVNDKRIRDLGF